MSPIRRPLTAAWRRRRTRRHDGLGTRRRANAATAPTTARSTHPSAPPTPRRRPTSKRKPRRPTAWSAAPRRCSIRS